MSQKRSPQEEEALIQTLLTRYETQLRRALAQRPRTLEQMEDCAEDIGNQVKRDLQTEIVGQEGTGEEGKQIACACGKQARYVADYSRRYVTRHGVLSLERAYYYCGSCRHGFCPLDIRLGIGRSEYSPAVVALCARFAGYLPPRQAARELGEVCRITLAPNTLRQHAHRMGVSLQQEWEAEEEAFFAHPEREAAARPKQLQMTLDGVMVHIDGSWHEVKLGCAYTRGRFGGVEWAHYTAQYAPSSVFGKRFRVLGHLAGADNCPQVGIVGDGADWIWQEVGKYFPTKTQILDNYHALDQVWEVAHARFGTQGSAAEDWVDKQQGCLLADQVEEVLSAVRQWSPTTKEDQDLRRRVDNYLHTHQHRMRYQRFREQGYHIGSGVVEAGCRAVVQARLKGVGMRWKRAGAEAMLQLRCAICSTEQPDFRQLARQMLAA